MVHTCVLHVVYMNECTFMYMNECTFMYIMNVLYYIV